MAKGLFTDIQKSPYRDRIFIVLDSVHGQSLPEQLVSMGIPREKIIVWPKNGIEYYYPPEILDEIFGVGEEIAISGDKVSRNGRSYSKSELADKVVALLRHDTPMHPDFDRLLSTPLRATLAL